MTTSADDPLVTTDWLAARLDDPKVKIIDASYKMPGVLPLPSDDYLGGHIPGAVFSVFRRASEVPIYRIEKDPRLVRKQGMYSVITATGLILRRGHELERVLLVIDRKLAVV